jgi:hypothetical protein
VISRICEEFGCLPSQALHEPLQLALDVMDLRAYAQGKHLFETTKDAKDLPDGPTMDWVYRIAYERKQERNRRREAEATAPAAPSTSRAARASTADR